MSVGEIIVYLVIALLCGLLGQAVAGRSLGGYLVSTIVGLVGAVIGRVIAGAIGAPEVLVVNVGGKSIPLLWTIIGATLFTLLVTFLRRGTAKA